MDWTDDQIATLRRLWAEGHSTAEIGRRMGVTKNAIVGKARRLNLPARSSPIRRGPQSVSIRSNDEHDDDIRAMHSAGISQLQMAREMRVAPWFVHRRVEVMDLPRAVRSASLRVAAASMPAGYSRAKTCADVGAGRPWTYCTAPCLPGKSYCEDHHRGRYVPVQRVAETVR